MSLHPQPIPAIPEETVRIAHAVLPEGNVWMRMRDDLGTLYEDKDFQDLFPSRGQPAEAPWRLALVTLMQYGEGLTDRQAADAVRTRIDWKHVLSLELTDTGFDFSVLSEFRGRLLAHGAERRLFDLLLEQCRERGWIKARGRQRTDSTHVLAAIRTLRRLECVGETMRHALNVLAEVAPAWLLEHMDPQWAERYEKRFSDFRLPKEEKKRVELAETIGADGRRLLEQVYAERGLPWLRELDAIETLRRVWVQHYHASERDAPWRADGELPPSALLITSPYDVEARYSRKKSTAWTGYKVHFTETCEADTPHLIVEVTPTSATTADGDIVGDLHEQLAEQQLLPSQHLMDMGYVDAEVLTESQRRYQVDLVGPVMPDTSWASQEADRFDHSHFSIDWQAKQVVCPAGQTSRDWGHIPDRHGKPSLRVRFPLSVCRACPLHDRCTQTAAKVLILRPDEQTYTALQNARKRQETPAFRTLYASRAGIEGTVAQAVRTCEMRRARYIGSKKLRLQAFFTATAMNVLRACAWLAEGAHASPPVSRFAKLITSVKAATAA
ncbi:MAG: IS1182 family transposase [Ktedonobacteraceae bacterium]|jgi:transposase